MHKAVQNSSTSAPAKRRVLALLFAFLLLFAFSSPAQWMEPNRPRLGASAGFGGLHAWGKPSIDLHYGRLCGRFAPGLYYLSGGLTYQLAFFRPKSRKDRIITLSGYYLNDWLLANRRANEFRKDQHIYMLMPGIHVNLDHRGTIYLEVSGGPMYMHERIYNDDKSIRAVRDFWGPMGEIRIGGIFMSRKERVQQFPWNPKKPDVDKIEKRKLKFKD